MTRHTDKSPSPFPPSEGLLQFATELRTKYPHSCQVSRYKLGNPGETTDNYCCAEWGIAHPNSEPDFGAIARKDGFGPWRLSGRRGSFPFRIASTYDSGIVEYSPDWSD